MSGIKFEDKEFVYDGESHSVAITGELPNGVAEPTYTINEKVSSSAVNVGEYVVKASFANDDPNYEAIPDMEATLKITPATIDVSGIDLVFKQENGTDINGDQKVYDGWSVRFDLNDYSKLTNVATVSFSVLDSNGEVISTSNKKTNILNVGEYTVKAEFRLADTENYVAIDPIVKTFVVQYADYPMAEVLLRSERFVYDGREHSLKIEGEVPEEVVVSYEYYLDGKLLVDADQNPVQSVKDAGKYTVKAKFKLNEDNYAEIPELTATLEIEAINIDIALLGVLSDHSIEYSGQPFDPGLVTWKAITGNEYDVLVYSAITYYKLNRLGEYEKMPEGDIPINVGSYKFDITIKVADEYAKNYILSLSGSGQTYSCNFEIKRAVLETPEISFDDKYADLTYNGEGQDVEFDYTAHSEHITVSTKYYKLVGNEYVALGEDELPEVVGSYKTEVEITVNDVENYIFANGQHTVNASFEFNIDTLVLEVPQISFEGNESTITYNTEARDVEFTYTAHSKYITVSKTYLKLDGEEYVGMGEGNVPVGIGVYKCVVKVNVNNLNCVLANGEMSAEGSFEFTITPMVIEVPQFTFTSGRTLTYNGAEQPATFDCSVESEFIDISVSYKRYLDGEEIEMDSRYTYPIHVSSYECIVTATLNDPNCIFADGSDKVESDTFEYSIHTYVIDVAELGICETYDPDNMPEYAHTGGELHFEVFESLDFYKQQGFMKWELVNGYRRVDYGDHWEWSYADRVLDRGTYEVEYTITVLNSSSCALLYNGEQVTKLFIRHYFKIV
jgi:hypothetical protein